MTLRFFHILVLLAALPLLTGMASRPAAAYHPFYISVTEIQHNAADKALEISVRMFVEDLEEILKKQYKTPLDLGQARDKARLEQLIPDYLGRHLLLSVDGKAASLRFLGFEKEKESAYAYFEVPNVTSLKRADLQNSILYDFNEGQINIVHLTVGGRRQSSKVSFPVKSLSFQF
jgi:hypothetical protein